MTPTEQRLARTARDLTPEARDLVARQLRRLGREREADVAQGVARCGRYGALLDEAVGTHGQWARFDHLLSCVAARGADALKDNQARAAVFHPDQPEATCP